MWVQVFYGARGIQAKTLAVFCNPFVWCLGVRLCVFQALDAQDQARGTVLEFVEAFLCGMLLDEQG